MNLDAQALGLAGVCQAVCLALDLARGGRCDAAAARASSESILRIDAESAAAIFGGVAGVRLGLETLVAELEKPRELALMRIVATVLHLERKLSRRESLRDRLRQGIADAQSEAAVLGVDHESVVAKLAGTYVETISTLRPRIMVQGNGVFLAQAGIVARIRVLLLAAIRAAVLWRQGGGSGWRLLILRSQLSDAARAHLAQLS